MELPAPPAQWPRLDRMPSARTLSTKSRQLLQPQGGRPPSPVRRPGPLSLNTPFEVARVEAQSYTFSKDGRDSSQSPGLVPTLVRVAKERGVQGLFAGLTPRTLQACYQTVFLVSIPRIIATIS